MSCQGSVTLYDYIEYQHVNIELANAILNIADEEYERRSHFFHGRYENLYLDSAKLSLLRPVLDTALVKAAEIINLPLENLKLGFWLNIMNQGDVTSLHSHDDDDELLSAVYYVQVPPGSGLFRLHSDTEINEIVPQVGRYMFFDPAIPHEVLEHYNKIPRISIGMNIGPVS